MSDKKKLLKWADALRDMYHDCNSDDCCFYSPLYAADDIEAYLREQAEKEKE